MIPPFLSRLRHLLLLPVAAILLAGCGPGETAVERGDRDQVLHATIGSDLGTLDPHIVTDVASLDVLRAIQEGLIGEDPRNLSPVPGVAERWETSEDELTYTFHLNPNARWANGDPIVADDFLFSYERVLSPALGAQYAYMLFPVKNARAFNHGEITDFTQVGFEAPDARTLVIHLENPAPYFLSLLTNPSWWPVHPPTVLKHGRIDQRATGWTLAENFVGNGPFTLVEWRTGRPIITRKNPLYWDADRVRLNGIHFHPIESSDTQERAFRSGQLHFTKSIQPNRIDRYRETSPELIRSEPYLGVYFFRLNTRKEALRDTRVRQALLLAIDRDSIVRNVMHGWSEIAGSFTPPGASGYDPDVEISFDPERARALLAEAGYPDGEGFPPIDLLFNTQEVHRQIAETVQQMLRKNLNIRIGLYNQEFQAYLASVESGNYDMARAGWIGDYADPKTFLDLWLTDGGNNQTGWSNVEYDRLIHEADRTADERERFHLLERAETILLREAPVIPIYHYRNNYLIRPSVKGWYSNILDRHPYKDIYLEPLETEPSP